MTHTKEIIEKYLNSKADKSTQKTFADWLSAPVDAELKEANVRYIWLVRRYSAYQRMTHALSSLRHRIFIRL